MSVLMVYTTKISIITNLLRIYESCEFIRMYKAFSEIKMGMSKNQVLTLVGEPLDTFPVNEGIIGYKYSISDSYTNYRLRIVHFKNENLLE